MLEYLWLHLVRVLQLEASVDVLLCLRARKCVLVPRPGPAGHPVHHVPVEHLGGAAGGVGGAVQNQLEATIDGFSPLGAPAVVQRHRSGAPAGVPNRVVDCHVGAKLGAVLNVRGLPPRAVSSTHVVVVAAQDYRSRKRSVANGLVESKGNLDAGFGVGVEDACLRTDDHFVLVRLPDPVHVVFQLRHRFRRVSRHHILHVV
mmetsp:Transcript_61142/g.122569  ORF Transcript_61142/g.122569 Transcript_61142/m.122569 type:complete len:202 (-) Transcript_61142:217-822(-)